MMTPDIPTDRTVRPLTAADAVAFRVVRIEALTQAPGAYGSTLDDWARLPLSAYVARIEDGTVFGLFTPRGLEGLLAYDREKGGHARHRASLHAAYVREGLRGTGAVDALIAAVLDRARADALTQIELTVSEDNAPARAVCRRHGFVETGVLPRALCIDGAFLDEVAMVLRLDTA